MRKNRPPITGDLRLSGSISFTHSHEFSLVDYSLRYYGFPSRELNPQQPRGRIVVDIGTARGERSRT
jgi:hypothetical protein